jgi:hypothetical protein
MIGVFSHASIAALVSIVVTLLPLVAGVAYAIRPTEQRLAFMRPISLASIFAALSGLVLGAVNILRLVAMNDTPVAARIIVISAAESLVPLLMAFGFLTVAWLCVALGLRRHA